MTDRKLPSHVTMRVTPEQYVKVAHDADAAGMSVSDFARWRILDPSVPPLRTRNKSPVKDHIALLQVQALINASRLPNNLNQIAKAIHSGSFPITPETEAALRSSLAELTDIKALIFKALGREVV